jgi:hypothetical protein
MQALMAKHAALAKHKIKLDVGGRHFATSKETLLKFEGSFFFAMLSSGLWEPDEDGTYFIDRDSKYFPYLLRYMRTGSLKELTDLSKSSSFYDELDCVKEEFDFYQIEFPTPPSTLEWDTSIPPADTYGNKPVSLFRLDIFRGKKTQIYSYITCIYMHCQTQFRSVSHRVVLPTSVSEV